jgi:hypothetical protein
MILRRSIRRFAALAAVFSITLQALWPLVSHARPRDPSSLVPVCTINGITHYLDLKTGNAPLDERAALHGEHCKLCFFGSDRDVALAPPTAVAFFVSNSKDSKAVPVPVSHSEPADHPPAQPRAPPQVS